jgi:hypothetical protein
MQVFEIDSGLFRQHTLFSLFQRSLSANENNQRVPEPDR